MDKDLSHLVSVLSQRNMDSLDPDWRVSIIKNHKNTAYLSNQGIPIEYLAFHVGPPNQIVLTPSIFTKKNPSLNIGYVFFSTSSDDLDYYLENEQTMVYFADMRNVIEARVQKVYKHKVIFQDDVLEKSKIYERGLLSEDALKMYISDWLLKYTINFNPLRASSYKKSGDYILIASPIKLELNRLI